MTTALYRRYRPDTFADVIGQEHVTEPLMAALRKNRVNHAYLFSGPRGCGKTTSARILARCLNCAQGPTDAPCGQCESCIELATGGPGSLDVIEIDAASHGGVDDARDLRERATFAPVRDRLKIFIIDEAHMVTSAGFNALLKIVEEPPEHIKFIFATTEPDKVIGTIRSRTHHYPFRLVPPEPLMAYLSQLCERENVAVAPGVLSLVIRAGGGSVRDTLSVLDQLMAGAGPEGLNYELAVALLGYTHASLLDDVVESLAAGDAAAVFGAVDRVIQTGLDPRRFVEDLLERFRDLIVVGAVPENAASILRGVPEDQIARLRSQASQIGHADLSRSADICNEALNEMTGATSPRLHLELLCARLLLPAAEQGERSVATRLDRLERRLNYGGGAAQVQASGALGAPVQSPTGQSSVGQSSAGQGSTSASEVSDSIASAGSPQSATAAQASNAGQQLATPSSANDSKPTNSGLAPAAQDEAVAPLPAVSPDWGGSWGAAPAQNAPTQDAAAEKNSPVHNSPEHSSPVHNSAVHNSAGEQPQAPAVSDTTWNVVPSAHNPNTAQQGENNRVDSAPSPQPGRPAQPTQASPAAQSAPAAQSTQPSGNMQSVPPEAQHQPEAQQAPAGASQIDMIRRAWPDIMESLAGIKRSTWTLISQNSSPASFDGTTLTLNFGTSGLATRFGQGDYADHVRQAVKDVLGIDCTALARVGETSGASSTGQSHFDGGSPRSAGPDPKAPSSPLSAGRGDSPANHRPESTTTSHEPASHEPAPIEPDDPESFPPEFTGNAPTHSSQVTPTNTSGWGQAWSAPVDASPQGNERVWRKHQDSPTPAGSQSTEHAPGSSPSGQAGSGQASSGQAGSTQRSSGHSLSDQSSSNQAASGQSEPHPSSQSDSRPLTSIQSSEASAQVERPAPVTMPEVSGWLSPKASPEPEQRAKPAVQVPRGTSLAQGASSGVPGAPASPSFQSGPEPGCGSIEDAPSWISGDIGSPDTGTPAPANTSPESEGSPEAPAAAESSSRYQQMTAQARAEAKVQQSAQPPAARDVPDYEDIPSADDETIEESRLVGRAAVERILGGKLIEERSHKPE